MEQRKKKLVLLLYHHWVYCPSRSVLFIYMTIRRRPGTQKRTGGALVMFAWAIEPLYGQFGGEVVACRLG